MQYSLLHDHNPTKDRALGIFFLRFEFVLFGRWKMVILYIVFILGFTDLKTGAWKSAAGSTALHDLHFIRPKILKLICIWKV